MRVAELSRRSGVSVPTIKYYLREGLLPTGELRRPNQAEYGEEHVRRLALIRALGDIGGLSIAAIGEVLAAVDEPDRPIHAVLGAVQRGITTPPKDTAAPQARESASKMVDEMMERNGWRVNPDSPVYEQVVEVLAGLHAFGLVETEEDLDAYAAAAHQVAQVDVRMVLAKPGMDSILEGVVAGTVLGEALFGGLRRMSHEDVSAGFPGIDASQADGSWPRPG